VTLGYIQKEDFYNRKL